MMNRSHALDGLRGFAAAAVAYFHAILHNDLTLMDRVLYQPVHAAPDSQHLLSKIALTLLNGETAVFIFFVLSGAVLSLSLQRRDTGNFLLTSAVFIRNRVLRLYPPLVVCLLLMFALGLLGTPGLPRWEPKALLDNALLLATPIHGPSDTLRAEMMAIPLILSAWLLRRLFGTPGLVLAFAYCAMSLQAMGMMFGMPQMHVYGMFFMGGMLAAEPSLRGFLQQVPSHAWWLVLAMAVAGRVIHPHGSHSALIMSAVCCSLLVGGLLNGQRGSLQRLLEGRFAQSLGRVSFSLYLYNVPVLFILWGVWINDSAWAKGSPVFAGIVVGTLSLALTWPLAWASERWIERPFASFGNRRRAGPAAPADTAPA